MGHRFTQMGNGNECDDFRRTPGFIQFPLVIRVTPFPRPSFSLKYLFGKSALILWIFAALVLWIDQFFPEAGMRAGVWARFGALTVLTCAGIAAADVAIFKEG